MVHKGTAGAGLPQKEKPWRERCPYLGTYRWLQETKTLQLVNTKTGEIFTLEQLYNLIMRLAHGNDGTASVILNNWLAQPDRYLDDHELHAQEYSEIAFYCRKCLRAFYESRRTYDSDMDAFTALCPDCHQTVPHIPPEAKEHIGGLMAWFKQQDAEHRALEEDIAARKRAATVTSKRFAAVRKQVSDQINRVPARRTDKIKSAVNQPQPARRVRSASRACVRVRTGMDIPARRVRV